MKKLFFLCVLAGTVLAACHTQQTAYDRTDDKQDYERFISSHIFAACLNPGTPYATYSLAKLLKRPSNSDPRYKVTFVNGPCDGRTVWTEQVILQTEPVGTGELPTGTVLLRNFWNPKEPYNTDKTDRWNLGVVTNNQRLNQGIVDLAFPHDRNDFMPAREGVRLHNARRVVSPEVKDVRQFIH